MMTTPRLVSKSVPPLNGRHLWMGSVSAIAAAVVLTSAASPAFAQVRSGSSASGVQVTMQDGFEARRAGSKGRSANRNASRAIPREIPSIRDLQILGGNSVAAPVQTQVTTGAAPNIPSVQIDPSQIVATAPITIQSAGPVQRAINAAPGEAGINARAFAQFDDVQIDFNPSVAVDRVDVLASSAIIDWTTFDPGAAGTDVTFLGTGSNLQFTSSLGDYTVLNRVLTPGFDSAIRIDGSVSSNSFGGSSTGGNIWFYSAGGIVVGDTGSFNIGSLLLTTSEIDPADVTSGAFDVTFTGTPDSASSIRIDGGATLRANNSGSYIALVAPRIEQNGTVTANGSVAYVAAEQATMTIDNGLFDISVAVGTEDVNGIVHGETGSTGGAASTAITDEQAIYFVAVPKNDAITMLVGGSVGYDAAASASVNNGQIILTTGDRVERDERRVFSGGAFVDVGFNTVDTTVAGGLAGDITIENVELTSTTDVFAEGIVRVIARGTADDPRPITVDSGGSPTDLNLIGGDGVSVLVTGTGTIDISGSLNITAGDGVGDGGSISVNIDGTGAGASPLPTGSMSIGGDLSLNASGQGLDDVAGFVNNGGTEIGGDGVGGDISLTLGEDGALSVGGNIDLDASANGGRGLIRHGSAAAGDINLTIGNGDASIGGDIILDASANEAGTLVDNRTADEGSDSLAGDITFNISGGSISAGDLVMDVSAAATSGNNPGIAQSNDATAGDVTFNVTNGSHFFNSIDVNASAEARSSFSGELDSFSFGGRANRGTTTIALSNDDTTLAVGGSVSIFASYVGDTSGISGGGVDISVFNTGANSGTGLFVDGGLSISARTQEGTLGTATEGASVRISADNGRVTAGGLDVNVDSFRNPFSSSFTDRATDFVGGTVDLVSTNDGSIAFSGSSSISATGTGGAVSNDAGQGVGKGGTITILADNGAIRFGGDLDLAANGFAFAGTNSAGVSGVGSGGTIDITVQGNNGDLSFTGLDAGTDGSFEFDGEVVNTFFVGSGSNGSGGQTVFNVLGGQLSAVDITVSSDGEGGPGGELSDGTVNPLNDLLVTGDGGAGAGGEVTFNIDGGDATVANLTVTASGIGGDGAFGEDFSGTNAGNGGDAVGGTATLNALSGNLAVTDTLSVEATGNRQFSGNNFGGDGGDGRGTFGGDGGSSTGGNAVFNMTGSAVVDAAIVVVSTQAFGGDGGDSNADFGGAPDQAGGDGGNATGGTALFNDTAGDITFGTLTVNASGQGGEGGGSFGVSTSDAVGNGGAGGNGVGGSAQITLNQDDPDAKNYSVISRGIGGEGGIGAIAGAGGMGVGGIAELAINNVSVVFDQLTIDATAIGGDGGFIDGQLVTDGADGGDSDGGEARLVVAGANADFQANSSVALNSGAAGGTGRDGSFSFDDERDAGSGGVGGSAMGGSSTIIVRDNADIEISADAFSFNADSTGGLGGDGGDNFGAFTGRPGDDAPITSTSGAGGAGGSGTAGAVGIVAISGASVVITGGSGPLALSAIGSGGNGGEGGLALSRATVAGDGGTGGAGIGGSPLISATDASITIDDITLIAQGGGATAGDGGDNDVGGTSGTGASGGIGVGGTPLIELTGGTGGRILLGNVTILANGTGGTGTRGEDAGIGGGGEVTIRDISDASFGIETLDLTVDATGDAASNSGLLTITSDNSEIIIDGDLIADVTGNMLFAMDGDAQLNVFGSAALTATSGIEISRATENFSVTTFNIEGSLTANVTEGDFIALDNGDVFTNGAVAITAENISYDNIDSQTGAINLTATDGSITGTEFGTITGEDVLDAINLTATENITFGRLTPFQGNIDIDAGGDITGFLAVSDQFITMDAGGTIAVDIIETSSNIGLVTINGGAIDIGRLEAGFIVNLTTDIGDLSVDTLTTPSNVDLDSAGSIILGTANTGSFLASAQDDFTVGALTTTGGVADVIIGAGGFARFTSINSDRLLTIDAAEILGGAAVADGTLNFDASLIDVGDLTVDELGGILLTSDTDGIATGALTTVQGLITILSAAEADIGSATASTSFRLTTATDAIVGDVTTGGNLSIATGGNLTAGALFGGATSPGLDLDVGGDADVVSAGTNGLLNIDVTGALTGGDFTGASLVTIDAASVNVAALESTNQSVAVTASGNAVVGDAASNSNTTIAGASVTLNNADVGGNLRLNATGGSINGTGTLNVGSVANFDAAQDVTFGALNSAGVLTVDAGGDITSTGTNVTSSAITMNADGDITANDLITILTNGANNIVLNAGGVLDIASATAQNNILITADVANIGTLDARASFSTVTTVGAANIGNAISLGDTTITGGQAILQDADVGGTLRLSSTVTDIDITGTANVGQAVFLVAERDVNLAPAAQLVGGAFIGIDALRDVNFAGASISGTVINMDVTGNVTGDILEARLSNSANNVDLLVGGTLIANSITAANNITLNAAAIDVGTIDADGFNNTVTASGAVSIGNAISSRDTVITGSSVNIDAGAVGGNLAVVSTLGAITGLGSINVGQTADFASAADIAIGNLEANNIALTSAGDLRFNGLTSPNSIVLTAATGTIGATTPGLGDVNSGGLVDLTAEEIALGDIESDGSITAVTSVGDANFGNLTAGTFIDINAKGNPSVESVTSGGNVTLTGASVSLDGGDIGGALILDAQAGDISLAFDGTQQLLIGGSATFNATGDMIVTHTNNAAGTLSIDAGSSIGVNIGGSFNSGPGSIISSDGEVFIFTGANITANDLRAVPGIDLTAGGNVLLNNATAIGPQGSSNIRGVVIRAGLINVGSGTFLFDNIANATITGDVASYADITVTAGGNAVFASGSNTAADNGLTVNTGDDIIVEAGAFLSSANDPTDPINPVSPFDTGPNLNLNAGGEQNLLSLPATPIASIVIDGTLNANDAAIILQGDAIKGLDSMLIAGSIQVDVRDAPENVNFLSDDDGLLSGPCLEGFACLGDMEATGRIEIGQSSNNDLIGLFIEQATVNATDILITTRNDIVMGTSGIDTELNATGTFSATSLTGDVNLRDAVIVADQILIDAAGSLIGSGVLSSANDIGIDVGNSIIVGGIDTGGELTNVANVGGSIEGTYSVNGDFISGFFSQGSTSIDLSADGSIDIDQADSPDSIFLSAGGDAFLGNASVPGDIDILAQSVGYSSLDAGGSIFLDAAGGSIFADQFSQAFAGQDIEFISTDEIDIGDLSAGTDIFLDAGGNVFFGFLDAGINISIFAGGSVFGEDILSGGNVDIGGDDIDNVDVGDIDASETVNINGSSIAVRRVTANNISLNSQSDILFDLLQSANAINVEATNGQIATNNGPGDIVSDGEVSLLAEEINIGQIDAGGDVDATATAGGLTIEAIVSGGAIAVAAGNGAVNVGDLDAVSDITIDGAGVVTGDLLARGNSGDGDIDINSAGGVTIEIGSAAGAFSVTGEEIDFTAIDAGTDVSLTANGGALIGNQITAGSTAELAAGAGAIELTSLTASDANLLAMSGAILVEDAMVEGLVTAQGMAVNIASSDDLLIDATATDGDIGLNAFRSLGVESAIATGDIALSSNTGGMRIVTASGQNIDLVSPQDIEIDGTVDAAADLTVDAGSNFTVRGTATAQNIDITSGNVDILPDAILGDATRTQSITFNAFGDVAVGGDANDNPPPFLLDNTEFARIFSGGDIIFNAFSSGSGADAVLTLGTIDAIAGDGSSATGQNIGQTGALTLNADGDITIIGNATISGATADTEFVADAINLVRLNTQTGGIFMTDTNGALAGTISISATDFVATTDAAFVDIQGMSVADVDLRLADSDGVDRADGVIRAGTLDIATTSSQVFIQNTAPGTDFDQRRGFDVNTLSIASGGGTGSLQPIVVNGVIGGVTGFNTIPLANVLSVFDPASTINGCVIANPASCAPTSGPGPGPVTPTPVDPVDPNGTSSEVETRDLIDDGLDLTGVMQPGALEAGLINIEPNDEFATDPLIDDPVTGAGNEDLWVSDEEECESDGRCELEPAE